MSNSSYIAWSIQEPNGTLCQSTHFTKVDAIKKLMGISPLIKYYPSADPKWEEARKIGWKAVKVKVSKIELTAPAGDAGKQ